MSFALYSRRFLYGCRVQTYLTNLKAVIYSSLPYRDCFFIRIMVNLLRRKLFPRRATQLRLNDKLSRQGIYLPSLVTAYPPGSRCRIRWLLLPLNSNAGSCNEATNRPSTSVSIHCKQRHNASSRNSCSYV